VYNVAKTTIETFFSVNMVGFSKYFKKSNFTSTLDGLDEIDHTVTTIGYEYSTLIKKINVRESLYVNLGSSNQIISGSISNSKTSTYFLKIFNVNNTYDLVDIIPPVGTSSFNITAYTLSLYKSTIPKIFVYDLIERSSKLYIVEKFVSQLTAKRIGDSNSAFTFEYTNIISTGREKYIGDITYNLGYIKLFLTEVFFKFKDDNKYNKNLAISTDDNISTAYTSYEDIFFNTYSFDSILNIPVTYNTNTSKYEGNSRTVKDNYWFDFQFSTISGDFESIGTSLIYLGTWASSFYGMVNK
jgi:hypothetical protein